MKFNKLCAEGASDEDAFWKDMPGEDQVKVLCALSTSAGNAMMFVESTLKIKHLLVTGWLEG